MSVAPRLELALRPSRRWAWLLAVSLGAVALVCVGLPLPPWGRIGSIGALLGVGILAARDWRRLAGADLLLWDGAGWQLRARGDHVRLEDCRPEYVSPWLIVLSYRAPKRRRHLPLFSDAMTADGFRRLQVLVRSGLPV
ncbi:MAG: protein YgfX [Porticoccaceae bacterium]